MEGYDPRSGFGEETAQDYDELSRRGDEAETVAFLEELARGGPVLELAIGTGRIALPLAERGVAVDGVDLSEAMVARLRDKPGGDRLQVTIGDFADVPVDGEYRLIYVVFNTLYNLVTQDEQVRCFENVAAHLTDDGVFVVEASMPTSLHRLRDNQYVDAEAIGTVWVRLDVGRHDPVTQVLDETHVTLSAHGIRLAPVVTRYVWPARWTSWPGWPACACTVGGPDGSGSPSRPPPDATCRSTAADPDRFSCTTSHHCTTHHKCTRIGAHAHLRRRRTGLLDGGAGVSIDGIEHVQLAMPAGGEDRARTFYEGLLGLPETPKPPHLARRGGCWFESATTKIHLGVEPDFRPAKKAHPALLVRDLPALVARLREAGVVLVDDELLEGYDRVYAYDPFGNRLELMEPTGL